MTNAEGSLSRFVTAVGALDAATRMPGLEGQAQLFARMEDLQLAMEELQSHRGKFTAEQRVAALSAVESSRQLLNRLDGVFRFVEQMLQDRGTRHSSAWTYSRDSRRPAGPLPSKRSPSVELNA